MTTASPAPRPPAQTRTGGTGARDRASFEKLTRECMRAWVYTYVLACGHTRRTPRMRIDIHIHDLPTTTAQRVVPWRLTLLGSRKQLVQDREKEEKKEGREKWHACNAS